MTNTATEQPERTTSGIALMCAGVASLSANDALAKLLVEDHAPLQILFMRNVIALPFALALVLAIGGTGALRSHRPAAHLVRGVLWIAATILFFTSFRYLELAEATALIFVAPLFITALSALFLGEVVGRRRWLAVIAGFVGVLIVIRPGTAAFQPVSLLPVLTALIYALLMLSARWVDSRESVWTMLLYLTGTSAVLSALIVPFFWTPVRPENLWLFVAIALFGTAGMTMMTQAFRLAPAGIVAPLDYTGIVWATAFGWLIWREVPDAPAFIGAGVIICSGLFIIWREHRPAKPPGP
ncbi:EamA family transporter (plasmid) [Sulfitobacter alexandrii]|uniref:EamA family transporter n=1 Tax=Sulfitobacter alexandrii TaxID=1917485 RepID=A0A1J0WMV1_9RHOB|nr:DMT family transporter [Sulfitobacter alexandrii]APE45663.1 EamA family transporter [Sulfitobacter alexandrii]